MHTGADCKEHHQSMQKKQGAKRSKPRLKLKITSLLCAKITQSIANQSKRATAISTKLSTLYTDKRKWFDLEQINRFQDLYQSFEIAFEQSFLESSVSLQECPPLPDPMDFVFLRIGT